LKRVVLEGLWRRGREGPAIAGKKMLEKRALPMGEWAGAREK